MRIVFAIQSLGGFGGTESYVATVGDHLQRAGHDVWIYAVENGRFGEFAKSLGLRVCSTVEDLPDRIDAVLAQDAPASIEMLAARPDVPQAYIWHSELVDVQLPPQLNGAIAVIVALSGNAFRRINAMAVKSSVVQLTQPIDVYRFVSMSPINERPRIALYLGNYLRGERARMLREACEMAGVELRFVGEFADGFDAAPESAINQADIVFAKSRAALEAMACCRAVYVYDEFGCDGWVTPENFETFAEGAFAGNLTAHTVSVKSLAEDLGRYDASMGYINRDLVSARHNAINHIGAIAELIGGLADTRPDRAAAERSDLFELERLTRVNWRHEARSFRLAGEIEIVAAEREKQRIRADRAESELHQLRERVATEDRGVAAAKSAYESRRWHMINALLHPLDRLRGRV